MRTVNVIPTEIVMEALIECLQEYGLQESYRQANEKDAKAVEEMLQAAITRWNCGESFIRWQPVEVNGLHSDSRHCPFA